MRRFLPLFAVLVLLPACEHADPLDAGGIEPTLESIQTNIFDQSCAVSTCHVGNNAPLGLDLSAGNARQNLVGVPSIWNSNLDRVDPGNPDDSFLIIKLEGDDPRIGAGARMPLNMPPLSADEIGAVREWIADGAQ